MTGIVCAVRGGPASQPTIDRSVTLAQETGLPLYFLYVVNLDFLAHTTSSRVHTITHEMHQMGEFILLTAQTAAATQNVTAQKLVRHGNVTDEIIKLCHEIVADYVVLGRPQSEQEQSHFTQDRLAQFIEKLEELTGAKVVTAQAGEK
jgi:nucleotide-binding universal stress UspA family protein